MQHWQLDFKDASSVPADPHGKKQHVVETLNIIDKGTSVLVAHHVRSDFTAETALAAVAETFAEHGLPTSITLDRDTRWVGAPPSAVTSLLPWCAIVTRSESRWCSVIHITPNKMGLSNGTTGPSTRNA